MVLYKQDAFAMLLKERRKIYMGIIMPPKKAPKTKKSSDDKPTKDKPIKKDDVHKKNPGR